MKRAALVLFVFALSAGAVFGQDVSQNVTQNGGQVQETVSEKVSAENSTDGTVDNIAEDSSGGMTGSGQSAESDEASKPNPFIRFFKSFVTDYNYYLLLQNPEGWKMNLSDSVCLMTGRATNKGIFVNSLSSSLFNDLDYGYGNFLSAIQLTEDSTSLMLNNSFWLAKIYRDTEKSKDLFFRAGVDVLYNFEVTNDTGFSNNLFLGGALELTPCRWFSLNSNIYAGFRFSTIYAIQKEVPCIFNMDIQGDVQMYFTTPVKVNPYIEISSYEYFRYPLFCAPIFIAGVQYLPGEHFMVGAEGSVRYIDAFTLSSYIDSWVIRLYAGYRIK